MNKRIIKRRKRRLTPSELALIKMSKKLRPKNRPVTPQEVDESKKFYRKSMMKLRSYAGWKTRSLTPEEISCPRCGSPNIYFYDKEVHYNCECEDCHRKFSFKPRFLCCPMYDKPHTFKPKVVHIQPHIEMFYTYCPHHSPTTFSIVIGKSRGKKAFCRNSKIIL